MAHFTCPMHPEFKQDKSGICPECETSLIHHDHPGGGGSSEEADKAVCPVMNMPVSKREADTHGLIKIYKGKKYYLCCHTCTAMFDKNPEEYIHTQVGKQ